MYSTLFPEVKSRLEFTYAHTSKDGWMVRQGDCSKIFPRNADEDKEYELQMTRSYPKNSTYVHIYGKMKLPNSPCVNSSYLVTSITCHVIISKNVGNT